MHSSAIHNRDKTFVAPAFTTTQEKKDSGACREAKMAGDEPPASRANAAASCSAHSASWKKSPAPASGIGDAALDISMKQASPYDVTEFLAEGMAGTVCRCVHRATGKIRAVKKIDPEKFSPRDIAHEIVLMRLLRHENVVKCYDVFLEANFVNIVVDMFNGGDLVDGLNNHHKTYGQIPDGQLAYIANQMVAAISHVHSLKIIHRDVKGENFLLDRRIGDPNCRVALTDFGTAVRLEADARLHDQCGTVSFWSPEMWHGDYDWAVDVWAVGVTVFILAAGDVPFKGKEEVCGAKALRKPWAASPLCMGFINACLCRSSKRRPTASELMRCSWLTTPSTWVPPQTLSSVAISGLVTAIETIGWFTVDCVSMTLSGLGQLLKDADASKTSPAAGQLGAHGPPFGGHSGESINSGDAVGEELMLQGTLQISSKPDCDGSLKCREEGQEETAMRNSFTFRSGF